MDKLTRLLARITVALLLTFSGGQAMAIEEPDYAAVREGLGFELRRYAPQLLAETELLVAPRKTGSAAGFSRSTSPRRRGHCRISILSRLAVANIV